MWSVSSPNGDFLQMRERLYQIEETMFKKESPLEGGGGGILFPWNYTQARPDQHSRLSCPPFLVMFHYFLLPNSISSCMQAHPKSCTSCTMVFILLQAWSGKDPGRLSVPCRLAGAADGNGNWDCFFGSLPAWVGWRVVKHSMSKDPARQLISCLWSRDVETSLGH